MSLHGAPCVYCGRAMLHKGGDHTNPLWATKDHIIPVSAGGRGRKTVRCCRQCNEDKVHLSLNEWRAALSVRHRKLFIFHFEWVALRVLCLQAAEYARMLLASAGF